MTGGQAVNDPYTAGNGKATGSLQPELWGQLGMGRRKHSGFQERRL